MTRSEQNMEIARILGFEEGPRINGQRQWLYPAAFQEIQYGVPVTNLPDFVGMIESYIRFVMENPIVPQDYRTGS